MTCETLEALYAMAEATAAGEYKRREPKAFYALMDHALTGYKAEYVGDWDDRMGALQSAAAQANGLPPYAAWCGARTTTGRAAA